MPAVQLHCPHCGGLFQIDDSLSGQHVACPLCGSVVAIPELAPAGASGPPPPPPLEYSEAPSPTEETYQLGCPTCGGLFQATPSMGGQEISCPHCYSPVLLPDLGPPPASLPQGAYAPYPPEPTVYPEAPYQEPPFPEASGASPYTDVFTPRTRPNSPQFWETTPEYAPAAPQWQEPSPAMYQPATFEPATQQSAAFQPATFQPAPQPEFSEDDLLPPSAASREPASESSPSPAVPPTAPGKKKKKAKTKPSPAPAQTAETELDELLPPGIAPRAKQDATQQRSDVEELLPPTAETPRRNDRRESDSSPEDAAQAEGKRKGDAEGPVLLPTEDGEVIALREPVKTVVVGGREVELRRFTPEERERRRFRKNLFVAGFGLIFLIVTMIIMAIAGGL